MISLYVNGRSIRRQQVYGKDGRDWGTVLGLLTRRRTPVQCVTDLNAVHVMASLVTTEKKFSPACKLHSYLVTQAKEMTLPFYPIPFVPDFN